MDEMRRNRLLDNYIDAVKHFISEEIGSKYIITSSRTGINIEFYVYDGEINVSNLICIIPVEIDDVSLEKLANNKEYFGYSIASLVVYVRSRIAA